MTLAQAAVAVGGDTLNGGDIRFHGVCTDSRTIREGDLFVALRGERYDGHRFIERAVAAGAVAAMIDRKCDEPMPEGVPCAQVADTTAALGRLAAHWRRRFDIPVIAVVGSNGKTTVKEMIAACLRSHFGDSAVHATRGNLNNHIGVPLTLLSLRPEHRVSVAEIGMNHPGETAELARLVEPTIGVINNAQREHQEFMHSVADVAEEHASLIRALPPQGVAVFNADDPHADVWRAAAENHPIRDFGLRGNACIKARYTLKPASSTISVITPEGEIEFELPLAGQHNVYNALAAITAATAAGAALQACTVALGRFAAVKGRLQIKKGLRGATLIDDTYNANPDSVRAAIDVLAHSAGRRVLVLGDMGEVGAEGAAFHREMGDYARNAGIDALYATGEQSVHAVRVFGAGARHYRGVEELLADVLDTLAPQTTVLVKGSRFMQMERVIRGCESPGKET